jgi:two-component system sensor histidine kinase DctS
MSAVLDLSAQRSVEELSRQQQERLQATARLATVGEMASLLSHELNQPLAAIASYASGSLNLLDAPDDQTPALLKQALERIAEQAERAGRVIKSVHDFVRRREQLHEALGADPDRGGAAAGAPAGAQERHPHRARPADTGAARDAATARWSSRCC